MFGSALVSYGAMQSNLTYLNHLAIQTDLGSADTELLRMRSASAVVGRSRVSTPAGIRIQYSTKQMHTTSILHRKVLNKFLVKKRV